MSDFLALAPLTLRNNRSRRYQGDDMALPMSAFADSDQARIRNLYQFLQGLFAVFDDGGNCDENSIRALAAITPAATVSALLQETKLLGSDSGGENPDELFRKTVHDIRGGGLSFLLARLQFAEMDGWKMDDARTVFFLTRDHLKILRNSLLQLDDVQRNADMAPKLHGTALLVQKWHNALLVGGKSQTRMQVESNYDGYISESCVEFGALDRILYNLISNACRHTAEDTVRLFILKLPDEKNENLRFVLTNRLSESQRTELAGRNLRELFNPRVSSTGSGFGLTVVADFVANAYGLISRDKALAGGYVGAKIEGDQFLAWFHWPIARDI